MSKRQTLSDVTDACHRTLRYIRKDYDQIEFIRFKISDFKGETKDELVSMLVAEVQTCTPNTSNVVTKALHSVDIAFNLEESIRAIVYSLHDVLEEMLEAMIKYHTRLIETQSLATYFAGCRNITDT